MNKNRNNVQYMEKDEIDLKQLFAIILKHKKFIAKVVSIVTILAVIWALSKPNEYKVYTILAPQEQTTGINIGGLGALANMAGVNIGGSITPDIAFQDLLNNYAFMKNFIIKNNIDKKYLDPNFDKNFIFALHYRGLYDFFHSKDIKDINFFKDIYLPIQRMIFISTDDTTGIVNVSVIGPNRKFDYYLLNKFLEDATNYLVEKDILNINLKIKKYQKELSSTNNLELKAELIKLISNLIKQRVYINTSKYYKVKVITDPYIPDIKDKTKPKRALIVIISFIIGFILAVFIVLFKENKK